MEAAAIAFGQRERVRLDEELIRVAAGGDALPLLEFVLHQLYELTWRRARQAGQRPGDGAPDEPVLVLSLDD